MAKPITIKLLTPVEFAGKKYSELTLRSPKLKQLRSIQIEEGSNQINFDIPMAAACANVDEGVFDEIDLEDWKPIKKALRSLVPLEEAD